MNFYESESDFIVGKRGRLPRYLVCSMQGHFPVLAKTGPNSLAAIFRTGGPHMGTSATLAVAFSENGGISRSDPKEITPRWQDARNPALGTNAKGHIVAAYCKAIAFYSREELEKGRTAWTGKADSVSVFCRISRDGGNTWGAEIPIAANAPGFKMYCPYGRIISDPEGVMYMSVYGSSETSDTDNVAYMLRSYDGGESWGGESAFPLGFNETSYVFTKSGDMVAAARSGAGAVHVAKSDDRGKNWSEPVQVTRVGEHPADLCELESGKLFMTYGRRIRPMGCGALVSHDGGETWDHDREILLAGDGILNGDLGYPSTVQLDDGSINTALYFASGSEPSLGLCGSYGWGDVSCQLIKYAESDIVM